MKKADLKVFRDQLIDIRARLRGDVSSMASAALRKSGRTAEHSELALNIQRIARLDLDRRDAALHQGIEAQRCGSEELIVGRRLRRFHRRRDPATRLRNLFIGRAGAAHRMFVRARAAKDQMRMAVDQARRDPGSSKGNDFLGPKARQLCALSDAHDAPILNPDGAMFRNAEGIAGRRLHGRDAAVD